MTRTDGWYTVITFNDFSINWQSSLLRMYIIPQIKMHFTVIQFFQSSNVQRQKGRQRERGKKKKKKKNCVRVKA